MSVSTVVPKKKQTTHRKKVPTKRPMRALSHNRTEIERFLPRQAVIVQTLNQVFRQAVFVPDRQLLDRFDAVLTTLKVDLPEDMYPHALARLHTILCTTCPKIHHTSDTDSKDTHKKNAENAEPGWYWTGISRLAGVDEDDD